MDEYEGETLASEMMDESKPNTHGVWMSCPLRSFIHPELWATTGGWVEFLLSFTFFSLEGESVAGGVEDPGIVVGALDTRVETEGFSGQFPGVQGAGVGQVAVRLALDVTLALPLGEVAQGGDLGGVLHPLDNLQHGDKVDVVSVHHLGDELDQLLGEALVGLEPRGVEVEAQGGPVSAVVSVKVVPQKTTKLVPVEDI